MQKLTVVFENQTYEVEEGYGGLLYSDAGFVFERTRFDTYALYAKPRTLTYRGHGFTVKKHRDGLWRFDDGTIADIEEDAKSVDKKVRCGIGYFSLDEDHDLTDACRPHDHAYSSPAYQALHTRKEADDYLKRLVKLVYRSNKTKGSGIGSIFRWLSRTFGESLWENESTNN